jgi:subtilisin family serine protease
MRTPPRPSSRRRAAVVPSALGLVAAIAVAVVFAGSVSGAVESAARAAASAWNDVFGERPQASSAQRMVVVLAAPSLADSMARAETPLTESEQKRLVAEADAAQRVLIERLSERGVEIHRLRSFTRTLNGFSAVLDARAQTELERTDGVVGVYPVRTLYPAALTAQALTLPQLAAGAGRRTEAAVPGFDGAGVRIALLDSGVDLGHPYLAGRVQAGIDLVDGDRRAAAEPKPDDPGRLEPHGTRMAGLLVGAGGPTGLQGVAPGATLLPIRILGWEQADDGSYQLLGLGDTLLAGLERAVDPNRDGDVGDALPIALAAVVEPYASFPDSPEARAVAGAAQLGTLVVAPSGNDGRAGRGFGTVGAPGGAASALTVGAVDTRAETLEAETTLRAGGAEAFAGPAPVLGPFPPQGELPVVGLLGPSLADAARPADAFADGRVLADFFDPQGISRVAGRAALLAAGGGLEPRVRNAVAAGATAIVVAGTRVRAGSLDLDEGTAVPVVGIPAEAGEAALAALARGEAVSVAFAGVRGVANGSAGDVAPFSSGGMAFGGQVKPDLVAPGVGLATADGGVAADGTERYATATGSSVAAAVVAGAAAAVIQARPGLGAGELRSLLVGSARQIVLGGVPEPVTAQGAGIVDPVGAVSAEFSAEPVTLAYGRVNREGWNVTQTIRLRNLSTRSLEIDLGLTRDRWGAPELAFAAAPAHVSLPPGTSTDVALVASGAGPLEGEAGGSFVLAPEGSRAVRVPWAVSFRSETPTPLLDAVALSTDEFSPSDVAPAVLAFRAGSVSEDKQGQSVEPVQLLVVELWRGNRRLGVLTRFHDLLPGRYAFGVTGRGPQGRRLPAGEYVLRLVAYPPAGDVGASATNVDVPFRLRRT